MVIIQTDGLFITVVNSSFVPLEFILVPWAQDVALTLYFSYNLYSYKISLLRRGKIYIWREDSCSNE